MRRARTWAAGAGVATLLVLAVRKLLAREADHQPHHAREQPREPSPAQPPERPRGRAHIDWADDEAPYVRDRPDERPAETRHRDGGAPTALTVVALIVIVAAALGVTAAARIGEPVEHGVEGGDPSRAPAAFHSNGCIGCHAIPGIRGADGNVGPPLDRYRARSYIAGVLPNSPENLVRWILAPQAVDPGTDMPSIAMSEQEARDMAAYLRTLR